MSMQAQPLKLLQWHWEMNEPEKDGLKRNLSRLSHQLMQVFAATVARVISSKAAQVLMLDHQIDFWGIESFSTGVLEN